EGQTIESATIWESSRICAVTVEGQPERTRSGINLALGELLAGIGEVGLITGLTQIVSVFDARIFPVLKAAGCNPEIVGRPQRIGGIMCYAGMFDISENLLLALREFLSIEGSVLAPGAREAAFA